MALENFTTYTEVDTSNRLTVTATKADGVDVDRDIDVYLYKDYGANHFDALDIDFEIYISSNSLLYGIAGPALGTVVATFALLAATDIIISMERQAGPTYKIGLSKGWYAPDYYTCSANTLYYCTLSRVAGNDTVNLYIYSNSARTTLVDTLTVSGFGTAKWRYCYAFNNLNQPYSGADLDGYVQNMDLHEGWQNISYVNGIAAASISHKKGVAVASISKVKGIAV